MRKLLCSLAVLGMTASVASAGPHVGGVLWVHDTGVVYSTDTVLPPVTNPPANCAGVDNQQPLDAVSRIWKVYAAFPPGSHPRLKGLAWRIQFPESPADPYVYINENGCGVPDADGAGTDFWLASGGFPGVSGGQIGQSFPTGPRTTTVVELYFFTGFGYGASPTAFTLVEHTNPANRYFIDDGFPPNADPIESYGSLGFGQAGTTPCPTSDPDAACCAPAGTCTITKQSACPAGSVWHADWYTCSPNPCPMPTGACCYTDGRCQVVRESNCLQGGGFYQGNFVACTPNLCPVPAACCNPQTGICLVRIQSICAALPPAGTWVYHSDWPSCTPNPCPPPTTTGACCFRNAYCRILPVSRCLALRGTFVGGVCTPSVDPPCYVMGAPLPADEDAAKEQMDSWGQIKNRYR